jgi:hypothetical protein
VVKEARLFEESGRYYREGDDALPLAQRANFKWVAKERADLEKLLKPALTDAIRVAPADPEVWKWQWALAEVLANESAPDKLAEARRLIAEAAKGVPPSAPPRDRDRIAQLRKDLNEHK